MIETDLKTIASVIAAKPAGSIEGVRIRGASTDSRSTTEGDIFFALPGEAFDGHDFIPQARDAGAAACVVARDVAESEIPRLRVDDTLAAFGRCAAAHRRRLQAAVIAVTGSNGKTTTKSMIHHVLRSRFRGRAADKSFNNHVGVPLTLLSPDAEDQYLVVEIGSNAPGEVSALGALAAPDIAVITSIGPAHLEGLGGIPGVVREKSSLLQHVRCGGLAVVNIDHPEMRQHLTCGRHLLVDPSVEVLTVGRLPEAEVCVSDIRADLTGTVVQFADGTRIRLPICGAHNAMNAAATLAVCRRLGLNDQQVADALASYSPEPMRLNVNQCGSVTLINDCYNANPSSMGAAIDVLAASSGRRVLVAGDMLELGDRSEHWHRRVGAYAAEVGVHCLIAVGEFSGHLADEARQVSESIEVEQYRDAKSAAAAAESWLRPGDAVLVKGSRRLGLECVADAVKALTAEMPATATAS